MEWEKPEAIAVSLACEISSYANAELDEMPTRAQIETECAAG